MRAYHPHLLNATTHSVEAFQKPTANKAPSPGQLQPRPGSRSSLFGLYPDALQQFNGTARFWAQAEVFILHQQSLGAHLRQHPQRIRALQIIEDVCHLSITALDDLEDVQVALMKTSGVVMLDAFDLGKHTFAEAFERERMQAP
jgi:hypothetical protein